MASITLDKCRASATAKGTFLIVRSLVWKDYGFQVKR